MGKQKTRKAAQLYTMERLRPNEKGERIVENRQVVKDLKVGRRGTDKYMKPLGFESRKKIVVASDGQKYTILVWVLIA